MKLSILLKTAIASVLLRTGWVQTKLEQASQSGSCILMYHRIVPAGTCLGIEPGMYVTAETFDRQIRYLKKNLDIVSLEDLMPRDGTEIQGSRPRCSLTFDDGWQDFYAHAFPVLKAHQVPATVFLPTDYIGTNKWFWTDRLGHLLNHCSATPVTARNLSCNTISSKILSFSGTSEARLEMAISCLKASREDIIEQVLLELAHCLGVDENMPGRAFLNWAEVREMADSGLVLYGSHTSSHRIMTTLQDEEIWNELNTSRVRLLLEGVVSPDFIPFCYPNGNCNETIMKMVSELGYSLAVSTESGWNKDETADQLRLKRISIHEDMTSTDALFACRLACVFDT